MTTMTVVTKKTRMKTKNEERDDDHREEDVQGGLQAEAGGQGGEYDWTAPPRGLRGGRDVCQLRGPGWLTKWAKSEEIPFLINGRFLLHLPF